MIDPTNIKALFKRGQAYNICRDEDSALADLEKALKLQPNEKSVIKELQDIKSKIKARKDKEKKAYAKMFQ